MASFSEMLAREELKGEARINRFRLVALAIFAVNELVDYHVLGLSPAEFHRRMTIVTVGYTAFGVLAWAAVNRRRLYHPSLKFLFALADALFLTWALWVGEGAASPLVSVFYLQIAATGLRFSRPATMAAALFSAGAFLGLAWVRPSPGGAPVTVQVLGMLTMGVLAGQVVHHLRGLAAKFADTVERRKKVEGALVRYVSRQVAEQILRKMDEGAIALSGERRYVTVLFSDIRGFSRLAEKADPVELLALLNRYFQAMIDVVFRHDGTLDKFIGDALLVVFGAPLSQADSEARALRCALEMQKALDSFNEEQARRGQQALRMGIGVHAGEVVAGDLGSESRMEYTVLGEVVNLAERLQGKAEAGKILVSKAVRDKAGEGFRFKELAPFPVKGRDEPVTAYELA